MIVQIREPVLHPTPILALRPTQMTVGMREVALKRKSWAERDPETLEAFLGSHMVPVIIGPGGDRYLIDHHHLSLALHGAGVKSVFVTVVSDLHKLDPGLFWNMMDYHGWTHPFDEKGRRRDYADLPETIDDMKDDPYRSLAGELRNIGGFAKDSTPYSEFVWADFLRARIKPKEIKADFEAALRVALALAKSPEANYLPGWCASHVKEGKKKREKGNNSGD
jgi:hypothetical protein